jgi:hypothetical protein
MVQRSRLYSLCLTSRAEVTQALCVDAPCLKWLQEPLVEVRKTKELVMAECGCGRSPTGNCVGWHDLTEEQYLEKKAAYEAKKAAK